MDLKIRTIKCSVGILGLLLLQCPGMSAQTTHRIGVRVNGGGIGEFFDRTTGNTFVPRGNNLVRLDVQSFPDGTSGRYHSTLNPGLYDPFRIEAELSAMQANGYNVLKVWINNCCLTGSMVNPAGAFTRSLNLAYIDDMVDLARRAKAHGVYVVFTTDDVPYGFYRNLVYAEFDPVKFGYLNTEYLTLGGLNGTRLFWHDLILRLIQRGLPLDAVLAFEPREEMFFPFNYPPFTLSSGTIFATLSGKTYNMGDATSRRAAMDDNLPLWATGVRDQIIADDPSALVTIGFFWPKNDPNPTRLGDPREIFPYPAVMSSSLDYVSMSVYPFDTTFENIMQNFGNLAYPSKPAMIDEFGAVESAFPVEIDAAQNLEALQVDSCAFNVQGWMLWTYDTEAPEQTDGPFWSSRTQSGLVGQHLSPAFRPDPCKHNSTVNLTLPANPSQAGQQLEFLVNVASSSGTHATAPSGTIDLLEGGTVVQTGSLDVSGSADLTTSTLAAGAHWLHVGYVGDAKNTPGVTATFLHLVIDPALAATTVSLNSDLQPIVFRGKGAITAHVASAGATPTGSVLFLDGERLLQMVTLNGSGEAVVSTDIIGIGQHSIAAVYSGDAQNQVAASTPMLASRPPRPK